MKSRSLVVRRREHHSCRWGPHKTCGESSRPLEPGLGNFFGGGAELVVRTLEVFDRPVREAPDAGSHFVDHIVIMRNQQYRSFVTLRRDVQGVDRFQVEVIGRLVQQQDVGFLQSAKRQARPFPAGERFGDPASRWITKLKRVNPGACPSTITGVSPAVPVTSKIGQRSSSRIRAVCEVRTGGGF